MKILIVGTGGIGGYFGGKLAQAGNEVTFIARGAHLRAMQEKGLQVHSILGDFFLPSVQATDSLSEVGPQDLILICTKAWQVVDAAAQLGSAVGPDTVVIPLQNGVATREELLRYLPSTHIITGLCRIISKIEAPGVIKHFGVDPIIIIGEEDGFISDRLLNIQRIFLQARINLEISDQIQVELWNKFILICVGGLVAVTRSSYGAVRSHPYTRQLMIEVLTEGYRLAQAAGVGVSADIIDQSAAFIDSFPYESTSSLCRDIWEGRHSEIDYKNGSIVSLGQRYGVATPVNRFIYYSVLPLEEIARSKNI